MGKDEKAKDLQGMYLRSTSIILQVINFITPLPNREYDINAFDWTSQAGMNLNGDKEGFKLLLTDRPDLGRGDFRVHPDCNSWGTQGCIGLRRNNGTTYNNTLLRNFAASMEGYQKLHPKIKLSFQIPNNPNYANKEKSAPGN